MAAVAVSVTSFQAPIPIQNRLGITNRTLIPIPGSPAGRALFVRQRGILAKTKSRRVTRYVYNPGNALIVSRYRPRNGDLYRGKLELFDCDGGVSRPKSQYAN